MNNRDSIMNYTRGQAASDVKVELIGAATALGSAEDEELYLPLTGKLYRLTGLDGLDETGRPDFEVSESRTPGFFVHVSEPEALCLFFCPLLHNYVSYATAK